MNCFFAEVEQLEFIETLHEQDNQAMRGSSSVWGCLLDQLIDQLRVSRRVVQDNGVDPVERELRVVANSNVVFDPR